MTMGFEKLINRAKASRLVNKQDAQQMTHFYRETRTPLAHGIIRRLVTPSVGSGLP